MNQALLAVVSSLDTWAGPIKSRAITDSVDEEAEASGEASPERAASLRPALVEVRRVRCAQLFGAISAGGAGTPPGMPTSGQGCSPECAMLGLGAINCHLSTDDHEHC